MISKSNHTMAILEHTITALCQKSNGDSDGGGANGGMVVEGSGVIVDGAIKGDGGTKDGAVVDGTKRCTVEGASVAGASCDDGIANDVVSHNDVSLDGNIGSDDGVGMDDDEGGNTKMAQQIAIKENNCAATTATTTTTTTVTLMKPNKFAVAKISDTNIKKLQLSFSVDRLLSNDRFNANKQNNCNSNNNNNNNNHLSMQTNTANVCCNAAATLPIMPTVCCATNYNWTTTSTADDQLHDNGKFMKTMQRSTEPTTYDDEMHYVNPLCHTAASIAYQRSTPRTLANTVIRPKPLRAMAANKCTDAVSMKLSTHLAKFHHETQTASAHSSIAANSHGWSSPIVGFFPSKLNGNSNGSRSSVMSGGSAINNNGMLMDVAAISNLNLSANAISQQQPHYHPASMLHMPLGFDTAASVTASYNSNNNNNNHNNNHNNNTSSSSSGKSLIGSTAAGKRKRSWSRAVFSNLQRKGLEIQFQQQKYITKPDRRKLAARLNLTDAQVKVWFQNRRMKWRHTRENLKSGQEKQTTPQHSQHNDDAKHLTANEQLGYSTDSSATSLCASDNEDDNEIDVTG